MWIPIKTDDAVRAAVAIARAWPAQYVKADSLAASEGLPLPFLHNILGELRRAGIVHARRGHNGGYMLTRAPQDIDIAAVLDAVGSPLVAATTHIEGHGAVQDLWARLSTSAQAVLVHCSLADLTSTDDTH